MARPLRIQFAGAWYHLMNRGAGRRIIFPDDLHRHCFLEISQFYKTDRLRPVLGSARFRDGLQRFIEDSDAVEIPDRRWLRKSSDLETIIEATAFAFDFIPEALIRGRQGRTNVPRAVAMCFCRSPGGYSLKAIARAFGLRSYTSVSMAIRRLQPKLEDPNLRRIVERLKRRLFGFV